MEFKPGMSYNDLKTLESATGSVEKTNLIDQVGAANHHQRDPRLAASAGAVDKVNMAQAITPEKVEAVKQTIAKIRSQLKRDDEK